jgi:integrase/recombinase XerD
MTCYSAGLRVSEVVGLQIRDIDSKRMLMHIRAAKGKKDRMVVLSTKLLLTLRAYFRRFKPPGFTSLKERVAEPIVPLAHKALLRKQNNGPASDRKEAFICFAIVTQPSYWKGGTDVRYIQALPGQHSLQTTMRYTHI